MANVLKRKHQFQDVIGTKAVFKYKPDLGDFVDSMFAPRPVNLDEVEDHMRAAVLADMRYDLLRRGMANAATIAPLAPAPKQNPVDPTHDSRQAAYRNATIAAEQQKHAEAQARKAERARNLENPPDHPFQLSLIHI